jgi:hypothetical protein
MLARADRICGAVSRADRLAQRLDAMPDVSPYSFYGRGFIPPNREGVLRQVRSAETGSADVLFRRFEVQSAALEFAKERDRALQHAGVSEPLFVFARELDVTGRREYFVGSLHSFLYRSWRFEPRCFSEVLREGFACKLYFDLEQPLNATWSGALRTERVEQLDAAVARLVDTVLELVRESSPGGIRRSFLDVLELDSTIPTKYSRHLIFPNVLLRDNIAVGLFVKNRVLPRIAHDLPEDFVDLSVYSRNRCFRLPYSMKFGRSRALEPTNRWKGSVLLSLELEEQRRQTIKDAMLTNASYAMASSLETSASRPERMISAASQSQRCSQPDASGEFAERRYGQSPYLELETYIIDYARMRDDSAMPRIRSWMFFAASRTILYAMADHRYCARIQRQHRSNNVLYIVDLNQGQFFQKCLDPDCANWRSEAYSLPPHLLNRISESEPPDRTELREVRTSGEPQQPVSPNDDDQLGDEVLCDMLAAFEREHADTALEENLILGDDVLLGIAEISEMSQGLENVRMDTAEDIEAPKEYEKVLRAPTEGSLGGHRK